MCCNLPTPQVPAEAQPPDSAFGFHLDGLAPGLDGRGSDPMQLRRIGHRVETARIGGPEDARQRRRGEDPGSHPPDCDGHLRAAGVGR